MRRTSALLVLLIAAAVVAVWRFGAPTSGFAAEGQSSGSVPLQEALLTQGADRAPATPAVDEMGVFSRPRTSADVLPSDYSYRLHKVEPCEGWLEAHDACFGDDVTAGSRLILTDLGATHANLYAWPTTSEGVCWAFGAGSGLCVNTFDQPDGRAAFTGIDPDMAGSGAPGTIVGVVPDDVVAAEVVVHGVAHQARVESNGLFYELGDSSDTCRAIASLTVTYQDGSSDTFPRDKMSFGWQRSDADAELGHNPCGQ